MVTTLKPRVQTLRPKLTSINHTPRTRGRKWVDRRARWLEAHPLCCQCEQQRLVTAADEVDHITPLWMGGADSEANYQSLCVEHHKAKTAQEAKHRVSGAPGSF